ncbi:cadherin-like and PC-esterase domain-containing protein 1 isoform X2 [Ascaphus truei]|uniref:cadherin-like and PC-esterase domain-containing protein 1 isoform X2 n=1 Tax=Ascaphus truei TaxID=8439 RepID=UPI003F597948
MGWRRRYCPSPLLVVLAVAAACIFYQRLCASWDIEGSADDIKQVILRDATTKDKDCVLNWTSFYSRIQEFEDAIKKNLISSSKKRAFLYADPSLGIEEYNLYKHILTQQGYTVLSADIGIIKSAMKQQELFQGTLNYRDALIYIPSNKDEATKCIEKRELTDSHQFKMVNLLPEIQQLLCKKERICETAGRFPELQNLLICSTPYGRSSVRSSFSRSFVTHRGGDFGENKQYPAIHSMTETFEAPYNLRSDHAFNQQQSQDLLIRTYVLVSSLSPLRAFIHSVGIVQDQPNEKSVPIKLQVLFEQFFKQNSATQALNSMKETISKLLLTMEVLTETSALGPNTMNRCRVCFQLLTVDIGFNRSLYPIVLEVKEHFQFEDLNLEDQITKELILEDAFKFILQNKSFNFLDVLHNLQKCCSSTKKDTCWKNPTPELTWEEILILFNFAEELTSPGEFEMLYPSTSANVRMWLHELYHRVDPIKKLGSISAMHWLLSGILEHFQLMKNTATNFNSTVRHTLPETVKRELEAITSIRAETKQTNCSNDNNTQSHIRRIFSSPQLDLTPEFNPKIKEYYAEVPFDVVTVEIGAEAANCKSQVHLVEREGPRVANYPLGLGTNQITIHVTDESKSSSILRSYRITVNREDRPSLPLFDHYIMCGFVQPTLNRDKTQLSRMESPDTEIPQSNYAHHKRSSESRSPLHRGKMEGKDCGLIIHAEESCGLQPLSPVSLSSLSQAQQRKCESGDAKGQWLVPCLSCMDNRTCDWRAISWHPYSCQHPILLKTALQQCVKERKILFIGDSTNRGIMYYLIERVNETLQQWQKCHAMKFYNNVNNGKTFISYSYYPQFWIDASKRPSFENALEQLIERSHPLENTNQTVLIVGGVQWLNSNHLQIIDKVLKRDNLSDILVIVKSIGMGFHLPVYGIRSLSPVKHLFEENMLILRTAKLFGYEVVDTFSITMGRYKEFLQGKCGCHFHEVVKSSKFKERYQRKMKLLKSYAFGGQRIPQLQDHTSNSKSPYHIQGPVNQVYSEILFSRMCA